MEVLCNTSLGTDTNHLLSLANTYTSITWVSKLLVNDIWVVDSDARVELCQYRLEMDKNPNKASFSKEQYRLSRGHNAVTTTFSALDNSGLEKLVTFPTNTVQPYTTEITEVFWCQIEICIWLAKESISERESDNHHEIDSSSTDWMVDADTNRATFSKQLVMAVKEVGLVKANKDQQGYHTRPQYLGSYPHNLQVQIITTCEARYAAYHFTR